MVQCLLLRHRRRRATARAAADNDPCRSDCTELDLSRMGIQTLSEGIFEGMINLEMLNLEGNNIDFLPEDIFKGLSKLRSLLFNFNEIEVLQPDIFMGLSNLEWLSFPENEMKSLPADIFNGLSNLEKLSLSGNKISNLTAGIFEGLSNLNELYLFSNEIMALPADIFEGLSELKTVHLYDNKFETVPNKIIDQLRSLEADFKLFWEKEKSCGYCFFSVNEDGVLQRIPAQVINNVADNDPCGSGCEKLWLGGMRIQTLPQNIFQGMHNYYIDLDNNDITVLPPGIFDGLSDLEWLVIELNEIEKGTCGNCVFYVTRNGKLQRRGSGYYNFQDGICDGEYDFNCRQLSLYDMNISILPENVFQGRMGNLVELNLASNKIEGLPEGIFKGLTSLEKLHLEDNRISHVPRDVLWGLNLDSLRLCFPPARNFAGSIHVSTYKRVRGRFAVDQPRDMPDESPVSAMSEPMLESATQPTSYSSNMSGAFGQSVYMCDYNDSTYLSSVEKQIPNSISFEDATLSQEWGELGSVATWHGDLVITHPDKTLEPVIVILPALRSVSGSVILYNTQSIGSVILPNLVDISGKLMVSSNKNLKLFSAPSLRNVGGTKDEPCRDFPQQQCSVTAVFDEEAGLIIRNNPVLERLMLSRIVNATCMIVECNKNLSEVDLTGHSAGEDFDEFCETFKKAKMSNGNDQLQLMQAPWLDPETECTCPEEGFVLVERATGDRYECVEDFRHEFWFQFFVPLVAPLFFSWLLLSIQASRLPGTIRRYDSALRDHTGCPSAEDLGLAFSILLFTFALFCTTLFVTFIAPFFCAWLLFVPFRRYVTHDDEFARAVVQDEVPLLSSRLGFSRSSLFALIASVLLGVADLISDILFVKIFNTCNKLRVVSIIFVIVPAAMLLAGAFVAISVGMHAPDRLSSQTMHQGRSENDCDSEDEEGGSAIFHTSRLRLLSSKGSDISCSFQAILDLILGSLTVCFCAAEMKALSLLPWSIDNVPQEEKHSISVEDEVDALKTLRKLQLRLQRNEYLPDWQLEWQWLRVWMAFWSFVEDIAQIAIQLTFLFSRNGTDGCYPSFSEATGTTLSIVFSVLRLSEQLSWVGASVYDLLAAAVVGRSSREECSSPAADDDLVDGSQQLQLQQPRLQKPMLRGDSTVPAISR